MTTYDYNSPISEDGRHGVGSDGVDKFAGIRAVLQKRVGAPLPAEPPLPRIGAYAGLQLTLRKTGLRDSVADEASDGRCAKIPDFSRLKAGSKYSVRFENFEKYDHILLLRYRASRAGTSIRAFTVSGGKDRLYVYTQQTPQGAVINRAGLAGEKSDTHVVNLKQAVGKGEFVDFLGESVGRENFSRDMIVDKYRGFDIVVG